MRIVKSKSAAHCSYLREPEARMSMVSTQELHLLAGSWLIRRKFEIPAPCLCRGAHDRNASAGRQMWILLQASRRVRLTNKQGPGFLGAPLRSSEPKPHPHAIKPTLTQVQRSSEPSSDATWREDGVVSGPRNPHGSRQGKPRGTLTTATEPDTSRRCCDHQDPEEPMV